MPDSIDKIKFANAALELWRGSARSLNRVEDSTNSVYSFIQTGEQRFLRLTPNRLRTKNQIEAELDFVIFLHQNGVNTALPITSADERLVEEIVVAEKSLFACVFEEAKGERFKYDSAESNKEHFRLRGRTLGQIHTLSEIYIPPGDCRRFDWDEDRLLIEADEILPMSEKIVRREYEKLKEQLQDYRKSDRTFGLIHGDFGETNYRYKSDRLNVFDFDDCCYHWFIYDVAVTIYPHGWRKEGLRLLDWLLEGYAEKMPVDFMLADITMFCRWRLIYMFLVYAEKWGFKNLSEQQAMWFAQKRKNIARGYEWQI